MCNPYKGWLYCKLSKWRGQTFLAVLAPGIEHELPCVAATFRESLGFTPHNNTLSLIGLKNDTSSFLTNRPVVLRGFTHRDKTKPNRHSPNGISLWITSIIRWLPRNMYWGNMRYYCHIVWCMRRSYCKKKTKRNMNWGMQYYCHIVWCMRWSYCKKKTPQETELR